MSDYMLVLTWSKSELMVAYFTVPAKENSSLHILVNPAKQGQP